MGLMYLMIESDSYLLFLLIECFLVDSLILVC